MVELMDKWKRDDEEGEKELEQLKEDVERLKKDNMEKRREIEIIDKQLHDILMGRRNKRKKLLEESERITEEVKMDKRQKEFDEMSMNEKLKMRSMLLNCVNKNWDITCLVQGNTVDSCNFIIEDYEERYKGREQDEVEIDDDDVTRARVNGRYFTDMEKSAVWPYGNNASQLETRMITAEEILAKEKQIESLWEVISSNDENELHS